MKPSKLWMLPLLAVGLAACGGDDADEGDVTADTAALGTASMDSGMTMPPGTDTSHAAAMGNAVTLNAVGTSGTTGEAQFMAHGDTQSMVTVTLAGAPAGGHAGHVHTGTCESPGAPVAPLQDVTADAAGAGSSTSTIDVGMTALMNGQHIVAFHEGTGASTGAPIACGAIPAAPATP